MSAAAAGGDWRRCDSWRVSVTFPFSYVSTLWWLFIAKNWPGFLYTCLCFPNASRSVHKITGYDLYTHILGPNSRPLIRQSINKSLKYIYKSLCGSTTPLELQNKSRVELERYFCSMQRPLDLCFGSFPLFTISWFGVLDIMIYELQVQCNRFCIY